jgi:hypothetical protein
MFRHDSCCMTKYDQMTSGVSHRHITGGTGESSSRKCVFCYFSFFEFFYNLKKKKLYLFFEFFEFLNFCDVKRKGWGYAHIREMGVSMVVCGDAAAPGVFVLNKLSH